METYGISIEDVEEIEENADGTYKLSGYSPCYNKDGTYVGKMFIEVSKASLPLSAVERIRKSMIKDSELYSVIKLKGKKRFLDEYGYIHGFDTIEIKKNNKMIPVGYSIAFKLAQNDEKFIFICVESEMNKVCEWAIDGEKDNLDYYWLVG